MKLTRRQLNAIITENLFGDFFGKNKEEKPNKGDAESIPQESKAPKSFLVLPPMGQFEKDEYAIDLHNNITMQIGNDFLPGYNSLDFPDGVVEYFNKYNVSDVDIDDLRGGLAFSKALPELHIITAKLSSLADAKEGMRIYLNYFLNGKKVKMSGGKLAGVQQGKQPGPDGKIGTADDTHLSDQQLTSYIKKLMT